MLFTSALKSLGIRNIVPKVVRTMKVDVLKALQDNYMYVVHDADKNAVVVDPYDYNQVADFVEQKNLNLTHVLTTHHHSDHAGGNIGLLAYMPSLVVCGGSQVNGINCVVHNDVIEVGSMLINCIPTPGHTMDHICYYINDTTCDQPSAVFTGDTLFVGGCGRLFEGTPSHLYESLVNKLGCLPKETLVYCGHEYGVKNLRFGAHICPFNGNIKQSLEKATDCIKRGQPFIPSTIGKEQEHNVFMMVDKPEMLKSFGMSTPIDLLGHLRKLKNNFT